MRLLGRKCGVAEKVVYLSAFISFGRFSILSGTFEGGSAWKRSKEICQGSNFRKDWDTGIRETGVVGTGVREAGGREERLVVSISWAGLASYQLLIELRWLLATISLSFGEQIIHAHWCWCCLVSQVEQHICTTLLSTRFVNLENFF